MKTSEVGVALIVVSLAAIPLLGQRLALGVPKAPPASEWKHDQKRDLGGAKDFAPDPMKFERIVIDSALGESVAVGDIDGDEKPDIVSGNFWYRNPDWRKFQFRRLGGTIEPDGKGYELCGGDDLLDVDDDGDLDVISSHLFDGTIAWHENPGPELAQGAGEWPVHPIATTGFIEFHMLADLDGDGRAREVVPNNNEIAWYSLNPSAPKGPWLRHGIRVAPPGHGIGVGDLNRDGRPDILVSGGWIEAPGNPDDAWISHSFSWARAAEEIVALDLDDDGDVDLLASEAHGYGLYWAENLGNGPAGGFEFQVHIIDGTWSQIHHLSLVDFDGDGDLDIVCGKRYLAHNGNDPGAYDPPTVVWYEKLKGANWAKHAISVDGDSGAGYRIPVVDVDGDGDLDVVVKSKKSGLVLFINQSQ